MRPITLLTLLLGLALTVRANPSQMTVDLSKSCDDQKKEQGAAMTAEYYNLCKNTQNSMGGWKTGGIVSCEDQKAAGGMTEDAFKQCEIAQKKSKGFIRRAAKGVAKLAVGIIVAIVLGSIACCSIPIICIVVWCCCCKKAIEAGSSNV